MFVRQSMLLLCLPLWSCASAPPAAGPALRGSTWRLLHFQSSDDAIGIVRPASGETYILTFGNDGSLVAQLNCNRGSGRWSAPDPSAARGAISLGPIAVTQRACLTETMRFSADLSHVRSYVIADGRLNLNLMADGGTYVLEPVP